MENQNPNVEHVPKSSSDQLLMKFAESGSTSKSDRRLTKRVKRSVSRRSSDRFPEKKSLLQSHGSVVVPWRLRFGKRDKFRGRLPKTKSILAAIDKTWRAAVEGASEMLIGSYYYNGHKRLIAAD